MKIQIPWYNEERNPAVWFLPVVSAAWDTVSGDEDSDLLVFTEVT